MTQGQTALRTPRPEQHRIDDAMHYSMNPSPDDLREGLRIVAKPSYPYRASPEILVVTSAPRGRPWQATDRHGNVFEGEYGRLAMKSATREGSFHVSWTLPLPEMDDEAALQWVSVLSKGEKAPMLVHVTEINDGMAKGHLVSTPWDTNRAEWIETDGLRYETRKVGLLDLTKKTIDLSAEGLPEGLAAGDLLCMHDWRNHVVDGVIVTKAWKTRSLYKDEPAVLAKAVAEADLPGLLPVRSVGSAEAEEGMISRRLFRLSSYETFATVDVTDLSTEDFAAQARTEPDEALVLWFIDDRGEHECHVLGSTGYTFHMCDSIADQFYGANVEPGLWVMRDAKWWSHTSYEGEHDSGIEGDWEPAKLEDLESFGYDNASLTVEIRGVLDEYGAGLPEGDLVPEWIAKAEAALAAEKAAEESRRHASL